MTVKLELFVTIVLCHHFYNVFANFYDDSSKWAVPNETLCKELIWEDYTPPETYEACPFNVNTTWISPREIDVFIEGQDVMHTFVGFFCQIRYFDLPVGRFELTEDIRLINCSPGFQNTAIMHTFKKDYHNYTLHWRASLNHRFKLFLSVILSVIHVPALYWKMNVTMPPLPQYMMADIPPIDMGKLSQDLTGLTQPTFNPKAQVLKDLENWYNSFPHRNRSCIRNITTFRSRN